MRQDAGQNIGTDPNRSVGDYVRFDFSADAFLHHMIRNIGALIMSARPRRAGMDRTIARGSRPHRCRPDLAAAGLCLRC
jgi:tRNA U38,U39,U40 pseudouridine synthase TruA